MPSGFGPNKEVVQAPIIVELMLARRAEVDKTVTAEFARSMSRPLPPLSRLADRFRMMAGREGSWFELMTH